MQFSIRSLDASRFRRARDLHAAPCTNRSRMVRSRDPSHWVLARLAGSSPRLATGSRSVYALRAAMSSLTLMEVAMTQAQIENDVIQRAPATCVMQSPDLAAEVRKLAALSLLDYERARLNAAARLDVRTTILDSEVK